MSDVIIIGGGPAGLSAALYTARAGLDTHVIYRDKGSLERAEKVENYMGFPGGISGHELLAAGREQARLLGATLTEAEVTGLSWEGLFIVSTTGGDFSSKAVILATGAPRTRPDIENIDTFDGSGVSWCATCDGFFCRGKDVAVLGGSQYAISEAEELLPLASSVTLLTNGAPVPENLPEGLRVDTRKVSSLKGSSSLEGIVFKEGSDMDVSRLFIALGVASSADLARKTGAIMENGSAAVDAVMATSVPGLFSAGDCNGAPYQVSIAVSQGAFAGMETAKFVRSLKKV